MGNLLPLAGDALEPLRRARQAADECELPLMMHISFGPPTLDEVLPFLMPGRHAHALLHRPRDEDRRRRGPAARRRRARVGLGRRHRRRPRHRLVLVRDRRGGDGRRAEAGRDLDRPPSAQRQRPGVRPADDAEQVPPPRHVAPRGDPRRRRSARPRSSGSSARSARCGRARAPTSRSSGSTRAASRCRTSTGTSARPSRLLREHADDRRRPGARAPAASAAARRGRASRSGRTSRSRSPRSSGRCASGDARPTRWRSPPGETVATP